MTKDILYLKLDQNVQVQSKSVTLGEIGKLECSNRELLNKLKTLKLKTSLEQKPGRYVLSVMDIISEIGKEYPNVEVNSLGETDMILTYEKKEQPSDLWSWMKTIFICVLAFFGAAFSIMTFNNDVNITRLFGQLFFQLTGRASDGFTVLECTYSIGLGLGILLFFNHFAGKKLTSDPTPMEVEMRLYENDINTTLIEADSREPKKKKKG